MKTKSWMRAVVIGVCAALPALTSCSTESKPQGQDSGAAGAAAAASGAETRGGAVVNTATTSAKVTGLDAQNRTVTLTRDDGSQTTFKAGPEIRNFDQIRLGDLVKATLTEELAVALRPSSAGPSAVAGSAVALAPKGEKPGILMADTAEITAKVTAIDATQREVALQLPDGSMRRVQVAKEIDLTGVKPGDEVTARVTKSLLIRVEAP